MPEMKFQTFDGMVSEHRAWEREVLPTEVLYDTEDAQLADVVYLTPQKGPGKPRDLLPHLEVPGGVCSGDGLERTNPFGIVRPVG